MARDVTILQFKLKPETAEFVRAEAARRGVTVSKLGAEYVEQGIAAEDLAIAKQFAMKAQYLVDNGHASTMEAALEIVKMMADRNAPKGTQQ